MGERRAILRDPIWEQQVGESARAFMCFKAYRDLGLGRSVTEAYRRATNRPGVKRATRSWTDWVEVWRWYERVAAWDSHLEAEQRKAQEAAARAEGERIAEARRQQRRKEIDVGDLLIQRAEEMLRMPVIEVTTERDTATGKVTQTVKPGKWRLADSARMLEVAVQLKRLALDLPTSRAAVVDIEEEVRQLARANGWDEEATVSAALKFSEERGDRAVGM